MEQDLFKPGLIKSVDSRVDRPLWSVMIPTFNREQYLQIAIESVLQQDLGPRQMQICVVDNASDRFDVLSLVNRLSDGRIEYRRHGENIGLTRNLNSCVNFARGRFIHILHDDDYVLPGFYAAMQAQAIDHPGASLFVCPAIAIDKDGVATSLSKPSNGPGKIEDFVLRQATSNSVLTPTIVVPRAIYEKVGGYAEALQFTLDWEFTSRVADAGYAVSLPMPYAAYREHEGSDTAMLIRGERHILEMRATIEELIGRLPDEYRGQVPERPFAFVANAADHYANRLAQLSEWDARIINLQWAYKLDPNKNRFTKLARARIKNALRR